MSHSKNSADQVSTYHFPIKAIYQGGKWMLDYDGKISELSEVPIDVLQVLSNTIYVSTGPIDLRDAMWNVINKRVVKVQRTAARVATELKEILAVPHQPDAMDSVFRRLCDEYISMIFSPSTYMETPQGDTVWSTQIKTSQFGNWAVGIMIRPDSSAVWVFTTENTGDYTLSEIASNALAKVPEDEPRINTSDVNCAIVLHLYRKGGM